MLHGPTPQHVLDAERAGQENPASIFGHVENEASAETEQPGFTSSWAAQMQGNKGGLGVPYDSHVGNPLPENAVERQLLNLQDEYRKYGNLGKPSAFAQSFQERGPNYAPDTSMYRHPILPFQGETEWPAVGLTDEQLAEPRVENSSWWGRGVDTHVQGLQLTNQLRRYPCNGCGGDTPVDPCPICYRRFCKGCTQRGLHQYCTPGGRTKEVLGHRPSHATSGSWGAYDIPSYADAHRGLDANLRIDHDCPELAEIQALSNNNRERDPQLRAKYWGQKESKGEAQSDRRSVRSSRSADRRSARSDPTGARGRLEEYGQGYLAAQRGTPPGHLNSGSFGDLPLPGRPAELGQSGSSLRRATSAIGSAVVNAASNVVSRFTSSDSRGLELTRTSGPDEQEFNPSEEDLMVLPEAYQHLHAGWQTQTVQCGVCAGELKAPQPCVRLTCQHVYHAACWNHYSTAKMTTRTGQETVARACKICAGSSTIVSCYNYTQVMVHNIAGDSSPETMQANDHSQSPSGPRTVSMGTTHSWCHVQEEPAYLDPDRGMVSMGGPESPSLVDSSDSLGTVHSRYSESSGQSTYLPIEPVSAQDAEEWGYSCSLNPNSTVTEPLVQVHNSSSNGGLDSQVRTRLSNKTALLVDVGAVGNLAGDVWAKEQAKKALASGRTPTERKRARGLQVAGVGKGQQTCHYDVDLPVAVPLADGSVMKGTFTTPTVPNSRLPALLGLQSLKNSRAIIDCNTSRVYFLGPGNYDLPAGLPPGTKEIQCEHAPSGHMMMTIDSFDQLARLESQGGLTIQETVLPTSHS